MVKYYSCTNVLFLCTKKRLNIPGLRDTTGIYALVLHLGSHFCGGQICI